MAQPCFACHPFLNVYYIVRSGIQQLGILQTYKLVKQLAKRCHLRVRLS